MVMELKQTAGLVFGGNIGPANSTTALTEE